MRPFLVLTAVILVAAAVFAQQPFPHPMNGACIYGCAPYVPMLTTPMISLQTVSPNAVGATNATAGLMAGATNSTLSQVESSTSSEYTAAVWYQGGAPITSSSVHLQPEPATRDWQPMHSMREEDSREGRAGREEGRADWTYFTARDHTEDAAQAANVAKGGKKATHVYTNDDVSRENEKNGTVKYDGKTEKM